MQKWTTTKGCRLLPIRMLLEDPNTGQPIDVSTSSFQFRMIAKDTGTVKVNNAACVIEDATGGAVRYDWAAADVDTAGEYWGWFIQNEISSSRKARYPVDGKKLAISIVEDY